MPEIPGRDEQILTAIINGTEYTKVPQSRIEYLLLQLKALIEGGLGVSDYTELDNKPQINSVTLIGNKSLSDLGLVNPMTIKGRVDTVADLANIQNPQPGWVYFVGSSSATELAEYVYIESGTKPVGAVIGDDTEWANDSTHGKIALLPDPVSKIVIDPQTSTGSQLFIDFTPDDDFSGIFLSDGTEVSYREDTVITPGSGYRYHFTYDLSGTYGGNSVISVLGNYGPAYDGSIPYHINRGYNFYVRYCGYKPTDDNGTYNVTLETDTYNSGYPNYHVHGYVAILAYPAKTIDITATVTQGTITFTPADDFVGFTENGSALSYTGDEVVPGDGRIYTLTYDSTNGHVMSVLGSEYTVNDDSVPMVAPDQLTSNMVVKACAYRATQVVSGSWQFLGYNNIVIDSALSDTSENPVQNKVITNALDGLMSYDSTNAKLKKTVGGVTSDVMAVDSSPTANSKNPVTSGAVNAGLALKADLSIFTPISESAYEALQTYDNPLYFIYEDAQ